ncbi:sterol 26-hydroxylase, mitochondrial [Pogona vitticeps]|uniref:Sterol 26-hydroxylase, mitochondrial n=1 Tax=Pogona vitticeps TaxID=103695 RepID=A0A6J0TL21_9SAUR
MAKWGRFAEKLRRGLGSQPGAPCPPLLGWRAVSGTAEAAAASPSEARLKGFEELPGPGILESTYWLLVRGYLLHTHRLQILSRKQYGPIWKSRFGSYININIGSPEILEELLRQEGKYPIRSDMALWKEHRDKRHLPYGPFTEDGERWHRLRQILNQRMLKPSEAVLYVDVINEVVSDLMTHLENERRKSTSGVVVQDIANVLYRFALEGISYILFETRIGCLEKQIPAETQHFIDAIGTMLKNSLFVTILPKWTRDMLPYWNRYLEGWDTIFAFGKKLINQRMVELEKCLERGEEVSGYLTYLLSSGRLSHEEVYGSIAELLLAGVDTTSNTLSWALYHLARNPDIQEELYQEVISVVPKDQIPDAKDLTRMPLLKAVIKETLRLYPVVPTNARIIAKNDVVVGGYKFPKDTLFVLAHYALSHDEASFPEPERFLPHRWLRDKRDILPHPFSSIPFGYGVRACVGRRIAELEMHLALARIIRIFLLKPDHQSMEVKPLARIVLVPDKPINLEFLHRETGL